MSAKLVFRLQRGSNWAKLAIFAIFFGFSNITSKLFILEKNFVHLNLDLKTHLFHPSKDPCDNFQQSYYEEKQSKIVKFTKIHMTKEELY